MGEGLVSTEGRRQKAVFVNWKKDKRDVVQFGQNAHTRQKSAKKKTLKSSYASLGGSITKTSNSALQRRGLTHPLDCRVRPDIRFLLCQGLIII